MDESLKRLLEAEKQAELIVKQGEEESAEISRKALEDAKAIEQQFIQRLPEMYQSFSDRAQERAEQTIAEIKLRSDERNKALRELADQHSDEAVEQALKLVLER